MSKIFKRYSPSSTTATPPPLTRSPTITSMPILEDHHHAMGQGDTHKDEEQKHPKSLSHHSHAFSFSQDEVSTTKHNKFVSTPIHHHNHKRRKHSLGTSSHPPIPDQFQGDEIVGDEEDEEEVEEDEDDSEEEEDEVEIEEYKQDNHHHHHPHSVGRKRKGGAGAGGVGRKSKNIPQCTRCNERAAWKHDKKGKRWFCKHCKLPFTPGVVPFNNKPKKENVVGEVVACARCGKTAPWPHNKTSKRKYICMKCKRPFRPDEEVDSDEDYMGYTSTDSRDRETMDRREVERGYNDSRDSSFTPSPDIIDDRESFQDYGASKILMALRGDGLFGLLA